jgi:hypothetical protein
MGAKLNLKGKRFSRLLVESEAGRDKRGAVLWQCVCDCGTQKVVPADQLRSGHTQSCGCLQSEAARRNGFANATHGGCRRGKRDKEYGVYRQMHTRCENPNSKDYPNYGGRGIKVCERWNKYEHFIADMGPRPSDDHEIDRIDNEGDYCPENCVWTLKRLNLGHTRKSVYMTINGVTKTQSEWADALGMNRMTLWSRKKRGMTDEEAIQKPLDERGKRKYRNPPTPPNETNETVP